jgi:hypothetical protein
MADYFLDLVAIDYRSLEARNKTTATIYKLANAYQEHRVLQCVLLCFHDKLCCHDNCHKTHLILC